MQVLLRASLTAHRRALLALLSMLGLLVPPASPAFGGVETRGAPQARADAVETDQDRPVTIDVLANDLDPQGKGLKVAGVTQPPSGGRASYTTSDVSFDPAGAFDFLTDGQHAVVTFDYTVRDTAGDVDTSTVTVTVRGHNDPPVAVAGVGFTVADGSAIGLDGRGSSDAEGTLSLSYEWSGEGAAFLDDVTSPTPLFDAAGAPPGDYKVTLTVEDGQGGRDVDTASITITSTRPVADAGPDQVLQSTHGFTGVQLDGTRSSDPDHDELTYTWTGPFKDTSEVTGPTPRVRIPVGTHTVVLTVSDGTDQASDEVQVTVLETVRIVRPYDHALVRTGDRPTVTGFATTGQPATVTLNDNTSVVVEPSRSGRWVTDELGVYREGINTITVESAGLTASIITTAVVDPSVFTCAGVQVTLIGSAGSDTFDGTQFADVIAGLAGNDTINGLGGGDHICGGPGNDVIDAGLGHDFVTGETGNDMIRGSSGADHLDGGPGMDVLLGGLGRDLLDGGPGADRLDGQGDRDRVNGGEGADLLHGGLDDDTLHGGPGDDELHGGPGSDILRGEDGNDYLLGGAHDDRLIGGSDVDRCNGMSGLNTFESCER